VEYLKISPLSNIPKLMFVYRDLNPKIFSNGAFLYPRCKCAILLNPEFWIFMDKNFLKSDHRHQGLLLLRSLIDLRSKAKFYMAGNGATFRNNLKISTLL